MIKLLIVVHPAVKVPLRPRLTVSIAAPVVIPMAVFPLGMPASRNWRRPSMPISVIRRQFRQKPPTHPLLLQAVTRRTTKTMRSSRNRSTCARIQRRSVTMGYFEKIYRSDLSHRARAVYMYLKDRADSSGSCWPGINTIAVELGLSRSTVKRALAELCREELIAKLPRQRSNGGCTSNLYRLL
jgi:GntR family transcriptional regulator